MNTAIPCGSCHGTGRVPFRREGEDESAPPTYFLCYSCGGFGHVVPTMASIMNMVTPKDLEPAQDPSPSERTAL